MTFASRADALAMTNEMPWEERDVPRTVYQMLRQTRDKFADRNAVTFQLQAGDGDPAETAGPEQTSIERCHVEWEI